MIGKQKPLVVLKVSIVLVIEKVRRPHVEVGEDSSIAVLRTELSESGQVGEAYGGVRAAIRGEVVEPRAECSALCTSKRVSSCLIDHS